MRSRRGDLWIRGARILTPTGTAPGDCIIRDGRIDGIVPRVSANDVPDLRILEARGDLLAPGFIDLHVHGGRGFDFSDAGRDGIAEIVQYHREHGTTSLIASIVPGSTASMRRAMETIIEAGDPGILGIHLEGPFISDARKGALNVQWLRSPSSDAFSGLVSGLEEAIAVVTYAPELGGSDLLLSRILEIDAIPAIGHTACSFAQGCTATQQGARHFTHLFNAMSPFGHREPGAVGTALASRSASVELIVDGIHIHPWVVAFVLEVFQRREELWRLCLVTDAIRAAGMQDGEYALGGLAVKVLNHVARLADGTLAGSTLTMDRAVRNVVQHAGLPISSAVGLAAANPASVLNLRGRKGEIVVGADADLVLLDPEHRVRATVAAGCIVYERDDPA